MPRRLPFEYSPAFEEFWAKYPRAKPGMSKQDAWKAWEMLTGTEQAAAIGALAQQAEAWRDIPDSYRKHAQGWLNGRRWEAFAPIGPKVDHGFYAEFGSPEQEAWDAFGKMNGRTYPRDKRGGWFFPTRWPPDNSVP